MATPSAEAKPRKRRFAPKARTGCQTCKTRRVKCDEERPSCHRCVSTGRICDGYDSIRLAQPNSQKDGTIALKWVQASPSPLPPESNGREQAAFYTFRLDLLETLAGPFEDVVWHRQVLPLSMAEPAVWHAVVALGSLGRANADINGQETRRFAIQQYSKAMKALQSRIISGKTLHQNLTLLICLLFVTFEFQQLGYGEAHSHLNSGLKIIQEYEQRPQLSPELTSDVMDPLVEAFERLDVQMSSFTSSQVHLKRSHSTISAVSGGRPLHFERVSDAMRDLNFLLGAMRDFNWETDAQRFSHEGLSSDDLMVFQEHMISLLKQLHRWHLAMNDLQSQINSIKDQISADILRVRQIYCKLKVATCLTDGRECLWDSYLPDFEQLVKTSEVVMFRRSVLSAENGKVNFTLDTGIIPSVYFTVLKCRDPNLRRRALMLLKNCKHQEGAWNGPIIASMAEKVMRLEERGLDSVYIAADVPEENRMYQAFYDLRRSDKLVFCKRRRFETDGAWIQYTVPFD